MLLLFNCLLNVLFSDITDRGRLPGECEEEALDLVQDEPTYGSVYYNIQV